MGIPKFFRYIAQRWPLSSQLVNDQVIPEFDNLYLDMNSILHMSTHANVENVGHLDEDQVFENIGNYIEHLFSVISPKKVFFMAIDGVAPRAKMNQQRSRRFRSALDAETQRRKAAAQGVDLDEDPFDSNSITPGTEFMARITVFLKYFIARKISEDSRWQECRIILSGHEVPGEGEHKIMKFFRGLRSQPDYDPNTRHCLYGLDADLIMLGLSTHEPHFALLREEVTFGRQIQFQSAELADKRFILLHLSVVRDYIHLEMENPENPNPVDMERVLDDLILILFFIGNDFLPELPMLLVNDGAIPVIFKTYKRYMVQSQNRYISRDGKIDFLALKEWMNLFKSYQIEKFEEQSLDSSWFTKQMDDVTEGKRAESEIILTKRQAEILGDLRKFMNHALSKGDLEDEFIVDDEHNFVELVAEQTGFLLEENKVKLNPESTIDPKQARRILRLYANSRIDDPDREKEYGEKFTEWKNRYYVRKFGDTYDSDTVRAVAEKYLEGLQWVLFYYYRGCPSWSWFYDNHYAPMTTELITAIGDGYTPTFELGEPFAPFEQLMSVLPDRSFALIPPSLRPLMLEPTSPLLDYYPHSFEVDKNGKKADWEAVVLIPFIDEKRLLKYVKPIEEKDLTDPERLRNARGVELEFIYDPNQNNFYKSPSAHFPDIAASTAVARQFSLPDSEIVYGMLPGAFHGTDSLAGFPSLFTLDFEWKLAKNEGVKVFEMPTRDDSVILDIRSNGTNVKGGQRVFVNWPFLVEAKVMHVKPYFDSNQIARSVNDTVASYKRKGVDIGPVNTLVVVRTLEGLNRQPDGAYKKDFSGSEIYIPEQLVVEKIKHEDPRFTERAAVPLDTEFPVNSDVLLLLAKYYGFPAKVTGHEDNAVTVEALVPKYRDSLFAITRDIVAAENAHIRWTSTDALAKGLGLSVKFLLQLTSRLIVQDSTGKAVNIAIVLRKHAMGLMAEGYTRLGYRNSWEFSDRGIALIVAYLREFKDVFKNAKTNSSIGKVSDAEIKKMRNWLNDHTASIAMMPTSTNHLTHKSVAEIEDKVTSAPPTHLEKVVLKGVERQALLSPTHAHHQLRSQSFKLGDRVVSALNFGKVPLFRRGVVVGINGGSSNNTTLDVLWDHEFGAASTLDGRTKTKRGLTVPAGSVLNLSNRQLAYHHEDYHVPQRIEARVNTRATAATAKKASHHPAGVSVTAKSFVPAAPRNEWARPSATQAASGTTAPVSANMFSALTLSDAPENPQHAPIPDGQTTVSSESVAPNPSGASKDSKGDFKQKTKPAKPAKQTKQGSPPTATGSDSKPSSTAQQQPKPKRQPQDKPDLKAKKEASEKRKPTVKPKAKGEGRKPAPKAEVRSAEASSAQPPPPETKNETEGSSSIDGSSDLSHKLTLPEVKPVRTNKPAAAKSLLNALYNR